MKKRKIVLGLLSLTCLFTLASCGEDTKGSSVSSSTSTSVTPTVPNNTDVTPTVPNNTDVTPTLPTEESNVPTQNPTSPLEEVEVLKYELTTDGTGYIVSEGNSKELLSKLEIPSTYNNLPVVEIKENGMKNLQVLELIIPSSVKKIGEEAFTGNSYLGIVDMSQCSLEICDGAFYGSELIAIDLGNTTKIGNEVFMASTLSSVVIPASVISIGDNAFNNNSITDVTFLGTTLPTLGLTVFGAREDANYRINLYGLETLWNNIAGDVTEDEIPKKIQQAMSVKYGAYYNINENEGANYGIHRGVATVYVAAGSNAAVVIDKTKMHLLNYSTKSVSFYYNSEKYVVKLDNDTKTSTRISPNEDGEYIDGSVLYDYDGISTTYFVNECVTEVAAGACLNNNYIRFVIFGDNVTKIGDCAFIGGYLFGVTFGKNINYIGEMAFFNQKYIHEVVFKGTTPPTMKSLAFCYVDTMGVVPTLYVNSVSSYLEPKIYTPLRPTSSFFSQKETTEFVNAFNQTLEGIGDSLVKDATTGEYVKYSDGSDGQFHQLTTSGLYTSGNEFTCDFGTFIMNGVDHGYCYVKLNDENYDGLGNYSGYGYAYISDLPGFTDDQSAKHIEIGFSYSNNEMRNFTVDGYFDLSKKTFNKRGEEADNYGVYGGNTIELDGYGNIKYYDSEGRTYIGTYTIDNNVVTVSGINGITTLTYVTSTQNNLHYLIVDGVDYNYLGIEAGVYYDYQHYAKIELDGTSVIIGDTKYDGKLIIEYQNKTVTYPYIFDKKNNKIQYTCKDSSGNDVSASFDFSKNSTNVLKGYYEGSSSNAYLEFQVAAVSEFIGTFNNGEDVLVLDGYFNCTYNGEKLNYAIIPNTNTIIIDTNNEVKIYYLNNDQTFNLPTSKLSGKYYVSISNNYSIIFDGNGNFIYRNGSNNYGTYTYDESTKEIKALTYNGNSCVTTVNGYLNEDGVGLFVYDYWGYNYMGLSKNPFAQISTYNNYISTTLYIINDDNTILEKSSKLYLTDDYVFVYFSGCAPIIVKNTIDYKTGATITINVNEILNVNVNVNFNISLNGSEYSCQTKVATYEYENIIVDEKEYVIIWKDAQKQIAAFYLVESMPTLYVYNVTWTNDTTFTIGNGLDITTGNYLLINGTNYGASNYSITIDYKTPVSYKSYSGLEYKYKYICVYSDSQLWVSNGNISGASAEIASYTTEVIDGVTYYTFIDTANNKKVTFKIIEGYYGNDFVVTSEVDVQ